MDELTQRLSNGSHPVAAGGPQASLEDLRRRVEELGFVFVKFTETTGGTDLGVRLDRTATDSSAADFDAGTGSVHLEGTLILNDDPVRCVADIDLSSLTGTGRLVPVAESELVSS
ncbi:hypothetical protein [Streptomyces sp. NPDC002078]